MSTWQGDGAPYERTMAGVVVGIVEQTTGDPAKLGRIKVRYPLFNNEVLSNWCRVASFFAGKGVGAYFLPSKGTEVLVAFEAGNLNVPYVIGALWNGQDTPPVEGEQKQQNVRAIKTKGGSLIRIDDSSGSEQIEIVDKSGDKILLDSAKRSVSISARGDIDISADTGKISLSASQIELSAKTTVKITGQVGVQVEASGEVAVRGALIRLN